MKPHELARQALEAYVTKRKRIDPEPIGKQAACFVSYHAANGELRGCIGTLAPDKADLAQEIVANAISAAMRDPRFLPIEPEELPGISVEVSVLGPLEAIASADELDVKRYGVVLESGRKRGVLLPDLEGVDTVAKQLEITMRKAGIRPGDPTQMERFEVIKYSDH